MYTIYEEGTLFHPIKYIFESLDSAVLQLYRLKEHMLYKNKKSMRVFQFELEMINEEKIEENVLILYKFKDEKGRFYKVFLTQEIT